ncbi:MAG: hypothetical protein ACOX4Q_01625 [Syntrophomonadales bacterium]|jgi:hypothetical protein
MIAPEKLFTYGKSITETELQKISKEMDYSLFHSMIEEMVEGGLLKPVKASGSNGRIPPLYNKYRIIKPREDYADYLEAIRRLNPRLNISAYLQHPEMYKKHLEIVEGLNQYLWYKAELLNEPMSRKERSFSIWGREKLLDQQFSLVREVLRFNGLNEDFLNFYDTPEPFFEYVHCQPQEMTALILENKDTWFTFRKLMQATGKNLIAGIAVDLLLYGEGNKITKKRALEEYATGMLRSQKGQTLKFLYFGDLDREGIRLFFRTREANPGLSIKPFAPLYQLMLKLARGREMPESQDKREIPVDIEEFARLLGHEEVGAIKRLLDNDRYIPQEIVNYQVLSGILS